MVQSGESNIERHCYPWKERRFPFESHGEGSLMLNVSLGDIQFANFSYHLGCSEPRAESQYRQRIFYGLRLHRKKYYYTVLV